MPRFVCLDADSHSASWTFGVADTMSFITSGDKLPYNIAVFIPEKVLSSSGEIAQVTITQLLKDESCVSEEEVKIGPTISITPHGTQFIRPILVFMWLPSSVITDTDHFEYVVAYHDGSSENVVLEEIDRFEDVSGTVLTDHCVAVLQLSHFSWFYILRRFRKKACDVDAFVSFVPSTGTVEVAYTLQDINDGDNKVYCRRTRRLIVFNFAILRIKA